ncbi:hypothetical protein T484DRAFT_1803072 [Baffinella frigidus]|nr:hypothetical protein T484DRAFT_1803072 [Cryptophyta sp. CCMP2293]
MQDGFSAWSKIADGFYEWGKIADGFFEWRRIARVDDAPGRVDGFFEWGKIARGRVVSRQRVVVLNKLLQQLRYHDTACPASSSPALANIVVEEWKLRVSAARIERRCRGEAVDTLRDLLGGLWQEVVLRCLKAWAEFLEKKRKAYQIWKKGRLAEGWACWIDLMQEFYVMKDAVLAKCSNVIHLLSGDYVRACTLAWRDILVRKKKAMQRWTQATELAAMTNWKDGPTRATELAAMANWKEAWQDAVEQRALLARVKRTWHHKTLRTAFLDYAEIADGRVFSRDLVCALITPSLNVNLRIVVNPTKAEIDAEFLFQTLTLNHAPSP